MAQQYRTKEGDSVDYICWKFYVTSKNTTEAVLEANRNLADLGEILPAGLLITLPDIEPVSENEITLF